MVHLYSCVSVSLLNLKYLASPTPKMIGDPEI